VFDDDGIMLADNTLWTPELYQLRRAPKADRDIWLFDGAKAALRELSSEPAWSETRVALASRTGQVEWAFYLLPKFEAAPGVSLNELTCGLQQIFPGSKRKHFERLKADSGVPFSEMIFFDDSQMNTREIEQMGVLCVLCPRGLTATIWERGLQTFASLKEEVRKSRSDHHTLHGAFLCPTPLRSPYTALCFPFVLAPLIPQYQGQGPSSPSWEISDFDNPCFARGRSQIPARIDRLPKKQGASFMGQTVLPGQVARGAK